MSRWDRNRTCTLRFWGTWRAVQSRPRTSSRYVVSFVVNATFTQAQGEG